MKVKRFTAGSMQKALKKVRDEMGPDAVILSNHRVNGGGVEIIVAQNYQPVSAHNAQRPYDAENDEQDSHLPSPSFLKPKVNKKTAKKSVKDNIATKESKKTIQRQQESHHQKNNPWPFLSDADREDVQEQLNLQDQLEQLKKQGHPIAAPAETPREPADAGALVHENKTQLKDQLQKLKNKRDNTFDEKIAEPQAPDVNPAVNPAVNSELKHALHDIKQQRQQSEVLNDGTPNANVAIDIQPQLAQVKANNKLIKDVRNELHDLTEMLKTGSGLAATASLKQNANFVWKKFSPENALQAKLWERLENMGFEDWLIFQLVNKTKSSEDEKQAWQNCLRDLTQHLNISPSDRLKRGGIFALVGPTGAGKTTTIAKMAVQFTLENEGAKVGLITMDNYRLAAHDQLRTLGQILGVPVQVSDQDHSLMQCIETLQECDLVLIDTAGLTPDHPMLKYQLEQLAQLEGRIHTLLTLPATSNSRVLRKVYHNYKAACLTGCVLSKTDEASSLGDAISVLLESALDLAYITDGQRIPDDFHRANAKHLIKQAVHVAQQEQQLVHAMNQAVSAW
ncbi:MAG: flagellar biosynthesis protein FlhF [Bermanella sp.]